MSDNRSMLPRGTLRRLLLGLMVVVGGTYFVWRLGTFNEDHMIYSALFYAAELYGFLISLLMIFTTSRPVLREAPAPEAGLSVDVFVTVYNEPLAVVRQTIAAAVRMDYPHETFLLDDGNRPEMKALAEEFGCRYLARGHNTDAKAGNLNHGLAHSDAEFVAIFDADHVATKHFLTRLLGYFRDPEVALVQTPQDYYNTDAFQYGRLRRRRFIWHDQTVFHYVGQTGRDHWNATAFCGCSAILRKSALDKIGGIATGTVTEDMHTAVRLQKHGFKTIYHAEPLAYGIAPVDFGGYCRQRLRWGEGNLQVCREEGLPFTRRLTLPQRICHFTLTAPFLEGWHKLALYVAPILVFFTGIAPITTDFVTFMFLFVPYYASALINFKIVGGGFGLVGGTEKYNMARFAVGMRATFGVFRSRISFRVSSKALNGRLDLLWLVPHILIFALGSAALIYASWTYIFSAYLYLPLWLGLFVGLWTALNVYYAAWVIANAIRCALLRETDFAFPLRLPIELTDVAGRKITCVTTAVSSAKIRFAATLPEGFESDVALTAKLYVPRRVLEFRGAISPEADSEAGTTFSLTPDWCDPADRDALDLTLMDCGWHRRWNGQREYARGVWLPGGGYANGGWPPLDEAVRRAVLYRPEHSAAERFAILEQRGPNKLALWTYADARLSFDSVAECRDPATGEHLYLQVTGGPLDISSLGDLEEFRETRWPYRQLTVGDVTRRMEEKLKWAS
ncbi:MAG: glycosyltransferase [Proteobacteria bacterium]|nr:glycosyltransferase [Pseudomonadota bacterium]